MASAQNFNPQKLPKEVKKAFNEKYTDAENAIWTLKSETIYYVNFLSKSKIHTASYNQLGVWLETRIGLKDSDLPTAVLKSVKKDYSSSTIKEVYKIEKPESTIVFEINLFEGESSSVIMMNANGEKIN